MRTERGGILWVSKRENNRKNSDCARNIIQWENTKAKNKNEQSKQ